MTKFRDLSIGRKLTAINLIVAAAALLLACAALMTRDVLSYRGDLVDEAAVYAQMVGANSSAAVTFADEKAAAEVLVSLRPARAVTAAVLFTPDGKPFATYRTRDDGVPLPSAAPRNASHRFTSGSLETWHHVQLNGQAVSSIYLRSSLRGLYTRIAWYGAILAFVFLDAILLALILSRRLQRVISAPVEHLAQTARAVSANRNYALRARKRGNDEIGQLTDDFNDMLEQIRLRDLELQARRENLEQEVKLRTQELISQSTQLTIARDIAQSASQAKSSFLANMSHEIRTPMSAILGYADLLLDPEQGPSDRLNHVQTIRRNGEHLLRIINDILDLSKIESGKMTVERIECSPLQIVAEVESLMRVKATDKSLELEVRADGPIPVSVQTDPTRLRQILLNLVGNAIKFTDHGKVSLIVTLDRPPSRTAPVALVFTVRDTGVGMAPQQIERIFQPFSQADPSTTRKFGGTGLGLTISRRLAQMLGGDILVRSSPGQGSTFDLRIDPGPLAGVKMTDNIREAPAAALPLPPVEAPGAFAGITTPPAQKPSPAEIARHIAPDLSGVKPPPNQSLPLQNIRILLAEDGPDNQRLISHHLRKAGAQVTIAENGVKAVDLVTAVEQTPHEFHLIFMDMQMPELDGYGATNKLRQRGHNLPIIALTAHAMAQDREKCLTAGCTDYLTKPVDRTRLIEIARKHLTPRPTPQQAA